MDIQTKTAIINLANIYGFEPAALLAVAEVESVGVPFWNVNNEKKPPIRFEGHYFYARLSGAKRAKAVAAGLAAENAGVVKNPVNYKARYDLLAKAVKIDKNAAYESTSWGMFQVMGANWKSLGYGNVQQLVNDADTVEGQIMMGIRFIMANNLKQYVDKHDWAAFAKAYNGKNYKANSYDTKLAASYADYKNATATQGHSIDMRQTIQIVQTMLVGIGYKEVTVTGVVDDAMKRAILDFQLKHGLNPDGVYGPITQEALQKAYRQAQIDKQGNLGKIGAAAGGAGTVVTEAANNVAPLSGGSHIIQWLFIALLVLGVGLTLYSLFARSKAK